MREREGEEREEREKGRKRGERERGRERGKRERGEGGRGEEGWVDR